MLNLDLPKSCGASEAYHTSLRARDNLQAQRSGGNMQMEAQDEFKLYTCIAVFMVCVPALLNGCLAALWS